MGQAGIPLSDPDRALLFNRDGAAASRIPSVSPVPSPPMSSPSSASPPSNPADAASKLQSRQQKGGGLTRP